jgi:hypothetical protein
MKKNLSLGAVVIAIIIGYFTQQNGTNFTLNADTSQRQAGTTIAQAFKQQKSDLQVGGSAQVIKILPDDLKGSRHQKFIIRVSGGQTMLVAHNIDLAPRVKGLRKGDRIEFYGEYEWNERGGVLHWTHRDPRGRHIDGWLKHNGKTYQ